MLTPLQLKKMNEKIKQFGEQAIHYAASRPMSELKDRDLYLDNLFEKFAELIVKECLSQVDKIRDGLEADSEDQQALGADWAGLAIARHFGVE